MRGIYYQLNSNVLKSRQVTIVTMNNYDKSYKREGNLSVQKEEEDW